MMVSAESRVLWAIMLSAQCLGKEEIQLVSFILQNEDPHALNAKILSTKH
jgi:hypothetical protein